MPADARALGLCQVRSAESARLYFVRGTFSPAELELLGRGLFSDPVVEGCTWQRLPGSSVEHPAVIEISPRPGVTDTVAAEVVRAAHELGVTGLVEAATGVRWELEVERASRAELDALARALLANPLVERWCLGRIEPAFACDAHPAEVERLPVHQMDDEALLSLSRERRAALDLAEMHAVREHFAREGRAASDVEFEMIAQTWSEHCVHKTFRALVEVEAPAGHPLPRRVDGILETFIKAPTAELAAPWVLSAFVDNAGVVALDDHHEVSFKVETHNHPSAVEPFGGANTGLGGVIRDIMGVSARPIAATDVLCFGPLDADPASLPRGSLHPRVIARGVISGIEDYGNKMGIPTVNGGVHYDLGYSANPLVYCGCVGLAPRGLRKSSPAGGDRVVVLGGRTGRDGIRGATFSSMRMDAATGEVAGASVQIGDPIAEKKALDVLLAARDRGLYNAVTDCGAGGLSSAVGEMGATLGVEVELARLGTKYQGLAPWELWLSEAQERMVFAVPKDNLGQFEALCDLYGSECWDLGSFTGDGRIVVRHHGSVVLDLPGVFLDEGLPRKRLRAAPGPRPAEGPPAAPPPDVRTRLLELLSVPGIASKEPIVRRYDHEVQGGTVVRPYAGPRGSAPQDAAVIKPQGTKGEVGIALSNGLRPSYARLDPWAAAVSAHDEALRNLVAVGADPSRVAVLDNFCMGDPGLPEVMWDLLESARGCRDAALYHRTPFISGKDSFHNEHLGSDGRRHAIVPSLLISALGVVPEVEKAITSFFKQAGNPVYLVGDFAARFGGSAHALRWRDPDGADPSVPGLPSAAPACYAALHGAMRAGEVLAAHDLSEGGLALTAAEMAAGGDLGAVLDISSLAAAGEAALFGETNGCLLVEVDAGAAAGFEARMSRVPCRRLGRVVEEERLRFTHGEVLLDVSLEELRVDPEEAE